MYDYEFYAEVDNLMGKQLKRCAMTMGTTILMLLIYLTTLPVRFYEWLKDIFTAEERSEKEITERIDNLMKSGHI